MFHVFNITISSWSYPETFSFKAVFKFRKILVYVKTAQNANSCDFRNKMPQIASNGMRTNQRSAFTHLKNTQIPFYPNRKRTQNVAHTVIVSRDVGAWQERGVEWHLSPVTCLTYLLRMEGGVPLTSVSRVRLGSRPTELTFNTGLASLLAFLYLYKRNFHGPINLNLAKIVLIQVVLKHRLVSKTWSDCSMFHVLFWQLSASTKGRSTDSSKPGSPTNATTARATMTRWFAVTCKWYHF